MAAHCQAVSLLWAEVSSEGPIRDAHRDKDDKERFMVLKGNVYGVPTAARVFSIERDRLMLEVLPKTTGWKVTIGMYESCMYKIQTDKGVVFINTHTDDCDCLLIHYHFRALAHSRYLLVVLPAGGTGTS